MWSRRPEERLLAAYTLVFGLWLLLPPSSFASTGFVRVVTRADEWQWGLLFFLAGTLHLFAVYVNGLRWWTPFYRAFTSALMAYMYGLLAFGIAEANLWSSGTIVYLALAALASSAFYAAVSDCHRNVTAWKGKRDA